MTAPNPQIQLVRSEPWVKELLAHFPIGATSNLPAPVRSFFICPRKRLLYAPIAKSACTSVKHLMMTLCELEHRELITRNGVHRATDAFITGAQLKDYDIETARTALDSEQYFRFSVVRDPIKRIISAYTEKFLLNREATANLFHTADVVRAVRCKSTPDFFAGISFREFVEYLLDSDPEELDSHWAPQHSLLKGPAQYTDIFAMEDMERMVQRLGEHLGHPIELEKYNVSLNETSDESSDKGRHVDALPVTLNDLASSLRPEDFMAPDLVRLLQQYYARDLELHSSALAGRSQYHESPLPLDASGTRSNGRPLSHVSNIARSVSLYSKGFYSLNDAGNGHIIIIITNTNSAPLDFSRIPHCYLTYIARDRDGNILYSDASEIDNPGLVPANSSVSSALDLRLPAELKDSTVSLAIALRLGDTFFVEDLSPVHVTSVRRLGG